MNQPLLRAGLASIRKMVMSTVAVLAAVLLCALHSYAQAGPPRINNDVISKAAEKANDRLGRTGAGRVKVKFDGVTDASGVRIKQYTDDQMRIQSGPPAYTYVPPGSTTTEYIALGYQWIQQQVPYVNSGDGPMLEVLTLIFMHEFEHMPECGNPVIHTGDIYTGTPPNCRELKQRENDSRFACESVQSVYADTTLTEADKASRVCAICRFIEEMRKEVDTPANLAAAGNCTTPPNDVNVADGQLFDQCCPWCCQLPAPCGTITNL